MWGLLNQYFFLRREHFECNANHLSFDHDTGTSGIMLLRGGGIKYVAEDVDHVDALDLLLGDLEVGTEGGVFLVPCRGSTFEDSWLDNSMVRCVVYDFNDFFNGRCSWSLSSQSYSTRLSTMHLIRRRISVSTQGFYRKCPGRLA